MNKPKIAFDMDGVFLPDYNHIPNFSEKDFFAQTLYAKPLFIPSYDYEVVTGRYEQWRDITEQWFDQLMNQPKTIHMRPQHMKSAKRYKAEKLLENPHIEIYVESELETVEYLKEHVNIQIIHYDEFVTSKILSLCQ